MRVCVRSLAWMFSDDPSDWYCRRKNTEYPALLNTSPLRDDVHLEDFMYLIRTRTRTRKVYFTRIVV